MFWWTLSPTPDKIPPTTSGVVTHISKPSTEEAVAEGLPQIHGGPGPDSELKAHLNCTMETLSQNINIQKKNSPLPLNLHWSTVLGH